MADELRELVKARRRELKLSYHSLAAACTEAGASVSSAWLHRLETGEVVVAPSAATLGGMAGGLRIDVARLREAAAAQFFDLRLPWNVTGEAADLLSMVAVLPDGQRRALTDLVRVMAEGH